jgi:predicted permease
VSLLSVILPVIIIVAAGYLLARYTTVETHSLSRVTIYVLSPSLVFTALVRTDLQAVGGYRLVALILVHFALLLVVSQVAGRLMRLPRAERSGTALATVLYNAGNYGLPVSLFAFGQQGFRLATVIYVLSAIVSQSLGVYLASAGRNSAGRAVGDVFRLPLIYAAILGLLFERTRWPIPDAVWRPIDLMGQGAIPMLLIALGVQLGQARPAVFSRSLAAVGALRLIVSPLLTAALIPWFGVSGLAGSVAILSTSMPTAVNAFLLAAQFDTAPAFVAGAVFLTTIVSFVTVSVVLALIR